MYANRIDTRDYPWTASVWYHGGLTATPSVNLVSNIGFGPDATHTTSASNELAHRKTQPLKALVHPSFIEMNREADRYVFDYHFRGRFLRYPAALLYLPRRAFGFLTRKIAKLWRCAVRWYVSCDDQSKSGSSGISVAR